MLRSLSLFCLLFPAALVALLSACRMDSEEELLEPLAEADAQATVTFQKAKAVLQPASGSSVQGLVSFLETEDGVTVDLRATGLTAGAHAVQIHENGDCSAADGSSAGGIFSPLGLPRVGAGAPEHHPAEIGNVEADGPATEVVASFHFDGKPFTILDGPTDVKGRSVIISERPDHLPEGPALLTGKRIACGVIRPI